MNKIGIFVGTMYGNSLLVANEAKKIIKERGYKTTIYHENPSLNDWIKYEDDYILIITSTTGHGNLPNGIRPLFQAIEAMACFQHNIRYGIIALGDSSYDNFCGGGKQFDAMLQNKGAYRIGDVLIIDAVKHSKPEILANQWIKHWISLLNQ